MIDIPISTFFIGVFILLQIPMTLMVGLRRMKTGIKFFDGGDEVLLWRMRAHGNYTETVPIVLIGLAAAEYTAMPTWGLWTLGCVFLAGRLMHAYTVVTRGAGTFRAAGMILTLVTMLCLALWLLSKAL